MTTTVIPAGEIIQIRASETARVVRCPGSKFLPARQTDSQPARLGTAYHKCAEAFLKGDDPEVSTQAVRYDVPLADLERKVSKGIYAWRDQKKFFPVFRTEVAMEWPLSDGVTLTGHADVVGVSPEHLHIADHKSGWAEKEHDAQLKTYGVLALLSMDSWDWHDSMSFDMKGVYVSVFMVETCCVENSYFTIRDLMAWRDELINAVKEGRGGGVLRTGAHCDYCPVLQCPLQSQLLANLPSGPPALTAETAVQYYEFRKFIDRYSEILDSGLKQFVNANGPIPAGNGKELRFNTSETEKIDFTPETNAVLMKYLDNDELYGALKISKTKVTEAISDKTETGKGAAIEAVLTELREAGVMSAELTSKFGIFKEKKN